MMAVITTSKLRKLAKAGHAEDVKHDGVAGLYARAQASGRVFWYGLAKSPSDTRSRWHKIGEWREERGMSLAEATTAWLTLREKIKSGETKKPQRKKAVLVSEALDLYFERHVSSLRPSTAREYRRALLKDVEPLWRGRKLTSIDRADIGDVLDIVHDRALEAGGSGVMANRVLAYVKSFMSWCVERGLLEASPAVAVKPRAKENARDRVLSLDEVSGLIRATERLKSPVHRVYVRALILAGQRREQTACMRWSNVDLEAGVWTIPAEDNKNGKPHAVPLAPQLVASMRQATPFEDCPYIFTTNGRAPISGYANLKAELDALLPGMEHWVFHDLRRTVATHLQSMNVRSEVIEAVLGHTPQGVTRKVYARYDFAAEKRQAVEMWADALLTYERATELADAA